MRFTLWFTQVPPDRAYGLHTREHPASQQLLTIDIGRLSTLELRMRQRQHRQLSLPLL